MWYLIIKKFFVIFGKERFFSKKTKRLAGQDGSLAEEFEKRRIYDPKWDMQILQSIVQQEQDELEKHVQTIFVLAMIAPLFGLLGTVTGMISTFEAISRFGTTNARAMASGISEALITTQAGLVISVPGMFAGHVIRQKTDAIQLRMDRFFLRMSLENCQNDAIKQNNTEMKMIKQEKKS